MRILEGLEHMSFVVNNTKKRNEMFDFKQVMFSVSISLQVISIVFLVSVNLDGIVMQRYLPCLLMCKSLSYDQTKINSIFCSSWEDGPFTLRLILQNWMYQISKANYSDRKRLNITKQLNQFVLKHFDVNSSQLKYLLC